MVFQDSTVTFVGFYLFVKMNKLVRPSSFSVLLSSQAEARLLDIWLLFLLFFLSRRANFMLPCLAGRPLFLFHVILELLGERGCLGLVQHADRGGIAGDSEESARKPVLTWGILGWYGRVLPFEIGTAHAGVQIIQEVFAALSYKSIVGPLLRLKLRVDQDELILHHRRDLE